MGPQFLYVSFGVFTTNNFLFCFLGHFDLHSIRCGLLVFRPGNSLTKSREFLENGVSSSGPDEGLCICIVSADEAVDFFDEVGGGLEGATTDGALGDESEEAFDLVEPGGIGGREVSANADGGRAKL